VDLPVLHGERLTLRPLTDDDLDQLAGIVAAPGVREWWGPIESIEELREELRNEGAAFAVEVDGAVAGWLGIAEETDPGAHYAALDIVLAPSFQDRRLGSEALRTAIAWLIGERGHHRITIDPAVANERAIRAYAAVGFRPVGVMRRYERGPDGSWHDNLLMDLMAVELRPPAAR
jgi:aminoglycoside 6'-N-acetyltransferase